MNLRNKAKKILPNHLVKVKKVIYLIKSSKKVDSLERNQLEYRIRNKINPIRKSSS